MESLRELYRIGPGPSSSHSLGVRNGCKYYMNKYPDYERYVASNITTSPFKNTEILQLKVKGKSPGQAQKANQLLLATFLHRMTDLQVSASGH